MTKECQQPDKMNEQDAQEIFWEHHPKLWDIVLSVTVIIILLLPKRFKKWIVKKHNSRYSKYM